MTRPMPFEPVPAFILLFRVGFIGFFPVPLLPNVRDRDYLRSRNRDSRSRQRKVPLSVRIFGWTPNEYCNEWE